MGLSTPKIQQFALTAFSFGLKKKIFVSGNSPPLLAETLSGILGRMIHL